MKLLSTSFRFLAPRVCAGARAAVGATCLLGAIATLLPRAGAQTGTSFGGGGGDAIGSLPCNTSDEEPGLGAGHQSKTKTHDVPARLVLVGPADELRALLFDHAGRFSAEPIEARARTGGMPWMRVRFEGPQTIALPSELLLSSSVSARFEPGPGFIGAVGALFGGEHRSTLLLHTGGIDLHLHKLLQSGLADSGVTLVARSKLDGSILAAPPIQLSIRTQGRALVLSQR